MKEYPSIPHIDRGTGEFCIAFTKYDGSNIRAEWTRKSGWSKFGTRTHLLGVDDPVFVEHEWRGELGGCTFGLMIDYAGIMKSDPTTGILKDYKTNRMPFTPHELETSFQLRVYELVLRRYLIPDVKNWIAGYEMFRFGWQACPPWNEDDLLAAED